MKAGDSSTGWRDFWRRYRRMEIASEADLFLEVGKTINGRRVAQEIFAQMIARVTELLALQPDDKLLELCCGNGLVTRRLASLVAEIEAVDFSEHLIAHARDFAAAPNVRYVCAEALAHLRALTRERRFVPTKILLGVALAYFQPESFRELLDEIASLTNGHFVFLATNIPSDELKWNFYNTPERRARFVDNQSRDDKTNDGLGRWWSKDELRHAGEALKLNVTLFDQPAALSDYRIDARYASPRGE